MNCRTSRSRQEHIQNPCGERIRRPVSRVLCRPGIAPWDAAAIPLDRPSPDGSRDLPGRLSQRRPCPRHTQAARTRRPYSVLLQAGLAMPSPSPGPRWALTPPFHPYPPSPEASEGGLLSVALSLGSPPAGVTRRLVAVEPGLSSPRTFRREGRPPGRLIRLRGWWPSPPASSHRRSGPNNGLSRSRSRQERPRA